MNFFGVHLVDVVVFLPLAGTALVVLLPPSEGRQIRAAAFLAMLADLAFAVWMYLRFDPRGPEFQLEFRARWIEELGISYHTGVDGFSVSLMLLTALLGPLVVLASWRSIEERVKEFHLALLFMQTAMLGAFASLDLVLFYVFWEAMLIPMYLLIGVWGAEQRQMAAVKFFLYTLVGSLLMLVAIVALSFLSQPAGSRSFDYAALYNGLIGASRELGACLASPDGAGAACAHLSPLASALKTYGPWMFLAFALAFAIKVPMFPLHTWLPDAHVQAPVAGSMILAGVLLKMGTFGFWRFAIPFFPLAARQMRPVLAALAVVGIVYGALMCLAQRDIKKLIAYSSVSHLGYCMLGMFALTLEGASGSAYQMLNHGVSTGALFLLFGMLYERRHTRLLADYGGVAKAMPVFSALFVIITFSSIAVPGTNAFVGEFLVLLGTFRSSLGLAFGVVAALGVILGAAYMLWMVQRVFFGPLVSEQSGGAHRSSLRDLNLRELCAALPLVALALGMGLLPQPFLDRLATSANRFVGRATLGAPESRSKDDDLKIQAMPLPPLAPAAAAPRFGRASPKAAF